MFSKKSLKKTMSNDIQEGILFLKDELETVIEKVKQLLQVKKYYYWFSCDGTNKTISISPLEHFELEQRRIDEIRQYIIDNK